jgi:hypothetical protein
VIDPPFQFLNGTSNPAGGCYNSSTNAQTYCCCAADSCNLALPGPRLSVTAENTLLMVALLMLVSSQIISSWLL